MSLSVLGIGTALPKHLFSQDELARLHGHFCRIDESRHRALRALYRRSGVRSRGSVVLERADGPLDERQSFFRPASDEHDRGQATADRMALYEEAAPPLAVAAARSALERAGVAARSVSHLITVSCTGFAAPGVDKAIIEGLGLSRGTQRTNVGFMGCHGAVNGIRVAESFVRADPGHVPLVCAVELCSLHFAYGWDPDMLVANSLFSDGAGAVVGARGNGHSDAWRIAASGTLLMPDSEEAMSWRIGDHGFRMTLSARVPELIETHVAPWLVGWLDARGLRVEDVGSWAVHPGGPRIVSSVARALRLSKEQTEVSREVLAECGNMSSATVLFILERLRSRGAPRPCVALAFGPGLVAEALLIR